MHRSWSIGLVAVALTGCVTSGTFKEQVAKTESAQKLAETTQTQLDETKKSLETSRTEGEKLKTDLTAAQGEVEKLKAQEQELRSQLKANEDEIAKLEKSNADLQETLEAKKGDLTKKIGELIKERDAVQQKLNETTQAKDAKQAELDTLQKTREAEKAELSSRLTTAQAEIAALKKAKEDEVARVRKNYEDLTSGLKAEIQAGQIQITELKGKLTLNMVDKILFDSGAAEVKGEGRKVLDRVSEALASVPDKDIRIEGHTDNVPIRGELAKKYPTNWELSAARAMAVARYLLDRGVDPKRIIITGFGDQRPVTGNDTAETRALNRRIDVVLVPRE